MEYETLLGTLMTEKTTFETQLEQTFISLLEKESFTDDEQKKIELCKKLLKKLRKEREYSNLQILKEEHKTKKFADAMMLLKEARAIEGLVEGLNDLLVSKFGPKYEADGKDEIVYETVDDDVSRDDIIDGDVLNKDDIKDIDKFIKLLESCTKEDWNKISDLMKRHFDDIDSEK